MSETKHADFYPEHDRTSCSDDSPINADAGGSCGCARCTAILLDQRDELLAVAEALIGSVTQQDERGNVYALGKLHAAVELARAAIAKATGATHD